MMPPLRWLPIIAITFMELIIISYPQINVFEIIIRLFVKNRLLSSLQNNKPKEKEIRH